MKKIFLGLIVLFSGVIALAGDVVVTAKTDKPDALYNINETATFIFDANAKGTVVWRVSLDGSNVISKGKAAFDLESLSVEGSLDKPGILRCDFTFIPGDKSETKKTAAGAAYEPLKIEPAAVMPEDFDVFWSQRKQQLACIPINPVLVPIESNSDKVDTYDLTTDCLGKQVHGYYAMPKDAKLKDCPAIIFLHGAGVSSARKSNITYFAERGFIALEINANGVVNGKEPEYYAHLYKTSLLNYRHWGKENQYNCYFTGMFTRVLRGLEFLKAQPQWDGKVLAAYGASQGGAQSLAAAGLDSDVNIIFSGVTAMCDHGGVVNGWPKFVPKESDGTFNKQILDAAMYNDGVNFARRAKAKAIFSCGFIDNVCRPTSVYAAYNSYQGEKEMLNAPLNAHPVPPEYYQYGKDKIIEFSKK